MKFDISTLTCRFDRLIADGGISNYFNTSPTEKAQEKHNDKVKRAVQSQIERKRNKERLRDGKREREREKARVFWLTSGRSWNRCQRTFLDRRLGLIKGVHLPHFSFLRQFTFLENLQRKKMRFRLHSQTAVIR